MSNESITTFYVSNDVIEDIHEYIHEALQEADESYEAMINDDWEAQVFSVDNVSVEVVMKQ